MATPSRLGPFARKALAGFLIGATFFLPGVSGGVIAVSLGYYEPVVAALGGFCQNARKNALYLLPLAAGAALGTALCAALLARWVQAAKVQAICFFLGLVAGGIPAHWRAAYGKSRLTKDDALSVALGMLVTLSFLLLDTDAGGTASARIGRGHALASGALLGLGAIVPGIAGSFLLIYFGWYAPLLQALTALDLSLLLPVVAGFFGAVFLLVKGADFLFRHHRRRMLSLVLGFVIGSLALVYPRSFFGPLWWANVPLLLLGAAAGLLMGRMDKEKTAP